MLTPNSPQFKGMIQTARMFLTQKEYASALKALESKEPMDRDCQVQLNLQIFEVYKAAGDNENASRYAKVVNMLDPTEPWTKDFLGKS